MSIGSIYQIITFAWQSFRRNFWLSIVTVSIIVLALISINFLVVLNVLTDNAIGVVKDKVDISIYFQRSATEPQVLEVKTFLSALPEVQEISYISQQQALQNFRQQHQQDADIIATLEQLKENPLGATLIVKAKKIDDYPIITKVIDQSKYTNLIADKNFDNNKAFIDRIKQIADNVNRIGWLTSAVFVLIAALIVFNTIRVATYTHREEIAIMKLVGATNGFIRSPFLLEGIFYGFCGLVGAIAVTYPLLKLIQPYVQSFFANQQLNLLTFFNHNFLVIFGLEFLLIVLLNILSSSFALRRYLKV